MQSEFFHNWCQSGEKLLNYRGLLVFTIFLAVLIVMKKAWKDFIFGEGIQILRVQSYFCRSHYQENFWTCTCWSACLCALRVLLLFSCEGRRSFGQVQVRENGAKCSSQALLGTLPHYENDKGDNKVNKPKIGFNVKDDSSESADGTWCLWSAIIFGGS